MKKVISIFLALTMLLSIGVASAASYSDTEGHWASSQIEAWSDYGVISGYDGQFSPDRTITRGEFAVILNRLMAYEKTVENRFADLSQKYYTDSILKLYKAGVMQGYDGKISPETFLTREEAAVMVCRTLGIEAAESANRAFSDDADVSEWARPYINAMVNAGLLNGFDGKINPKNTITRAEVVTILDNAVLPILKSEEFSDIKTEKTLVISAGNITVSNSEINGKVIITQGVKEGNVTFTESKINGDFVIDNERTEFIVLDNTTVDETLLENEAFVIKKEEEKPDEGSSDNESENSGTGSGNGSGSGSGSGSDKKDYKKINKEMVENLKAVSEDIALYLDPSDADYYSIFTNQEKYILTEIKKCVDEAVTYESKREINASFIKKTFADEIENVRSVYNQMAAEGKDGEFHSRLFVNLNSYTLFWLADALDIDLSEYGINAEDYINSIE